MRTLEFFPSRLTNRAFVDCQSLSAILYDQNLTQKVRRTYSWGGELPFLDVVRAYWQSSGEQLSALANLLFYDVSLVNLQALKANGLLHSLEQSPLQELVAPVKIGMDIYKEVKEILFKFDEEAKKQGLDSSRMEDHFDPFLKKEVDKLASDQELLFSRIADSTGPVHLRALFYFELSRIGSLPLILHPSKFELVHDFDDLMLTPPASAALKNIIKKRRQAAGMSFEQKLPSLETLILRTAQERDLSPIQAAIEMHKSTSCEDLRKLLHRVQDAILDDDELKKKELFSETNQYVQRWIENCDPGEGLVSFTKRIKLKSIPGISDLELDPAIIDYKLPKEKPLGWVKRPPMYLFFLSDWVAERPQGFAPET